MFRANKVPGVAVLFALLLIFPTTAAAISTITFDEAGIIPNVTTDPGFTQIPVSFVGTGVGDIIFSAGEARLFEDTFVTDLTGLSGNSLANGFVGGNAVINVEILALPLIFVSAAFDIDSVLDAELVLEGYDGDGALVASNSVAELALDVAWSNSISLFYPGGLSALRFFTQNPSLQLFNIDNFSFEVVPEPATMLLMLAGLGGLAVWRRRR